MFFITFGTIGINLWQGTWLQRCHAVVPREGCDHDTSDGAHCTHALEYAGDRSKFCNLESVFPERGSCPEGDRCTLHHTNPFFGIPNFDSMPHAVRARPPGV